MWQNEERELRVLELRNEAAYPPFTNPIKHTLWRKKKPTQTTVHMNGICLQNFLNFGFAL